MIHIKENRQIIHETGKRKEEISLLVDGGKVRPLDAGKQTKGNRPVPNVFCDVSLPTFLGCLR